jgi:hypothetical protein
MWGRKNIDCLKCEVRCTEIIKTAQRKLLEYLIAEYLDGGGLWATSKLRRNLEEMLEQLEAK